MTTPEKIICYSSHAMQGHTGQRPGGSGGQSQRAGQMGARAFIVVFAGRNGRGSKQAKQVGQFECFQKVPGCRSLRSLPYSCLEGKSLIKEAVRGDMGGLHVKSKLPGDSCISSKNQLTLGMEVPPGSTQI